MKKFFLGLFVILFSATVANAQKSGFENARQLLNKKTAKTSLKANKAPSRISLESDERILGYYTTDDLDLTGGSSLGMNTAPGVYPVSVVFTPDVIGNFVGGQITKVRFGLSEPVGPSSVYVATIDINSGVMSEHLAEARLETTASGWNDVTFDTPVTIEPNTSYLISYEYAQESTYSMGQYIANNYPLLVDGSVNPGGETQYGFMIYGDFGQGTDWYTMTGQGYGNLCVQAVVKGGTFIDEDITLDGMSAVNTYCKNGEKASFTFGIKSNGNIIPSSYTLDVAVDGNVVSTLDTPVPLSNSIQQVSAGVTLPEGLSAGSHVVSLSVATINGNKPVENTNDDEVSTKVNTYTESVPRVMSLVEQYTSTYCGYCPLGSELVAELQAIRGDIAWVSVHTSQMGPDVFVTDAGTTLADMFGASLIGIPAGAFNRYYIDDNTLNSRGYIPVGIGYDDIPTYAEMFSDIINESNQMPAFAGVDISTDYDQVTRQLTVTVSGNITADFATYVGNDAALTVYLTEDGLVSTQTDYSLPGRYDEDYVHNNVLRAVVSENVFGDPLTMTGTGTYSNTYTVTLDSEWNADNMHIVAFVGRPVGDNSSADDVWINNTNMAKVGGSSTGIDDSVIADKSLTEVARYTLDGTLVDRPVKGVNIVKMSDGSTRKVVVK